MYIKHSQGRQEPQLSSSFCTSTYITSPDQQQQQPRDLCIPPNFELGLKTEPQLNNMGANSGFGIKAEVANFSLKPDNSTFDDKTDPNFSLKNVSNFGHKTEGSSFGLKAEDTFALKAEDGNIFSLKTEDGSASCSFSSSL